MNARLCVAARSANLRAALRMLVWAAAALAVLSATAWAQPRSPEGGPAMEARPQAGPPRTGPMEANFFPPELVMRHQKAIGLTAEQQTAIKSAMEKAMPHFTDLQWKQSAEEETMQTLLSQDHPDEKQTLAQLDKLLAVENDVKRNHMALLIQIKNVLTPEQQAKLRELMPARQGPRPDLRGPDADGGQRPDGRGPGGKRSPEAPPRDAGQR